MTAETMEEGVGKSMRTQAFALMMTPLLMTGSKSGVNDAQKDGVESQDLDQVIRMQNTENSQKAARSQDLEKENIVNSQVPKKKLSFEEPDVLMEEVSVDEGERAEILTKTLASASSQKSAASKNTSEMVHGVVIFEYSIVSSVAFLFLMPIPIDGTSTECMILSLRSWGARKTRARRLRCRPTR